MNQPDQPRIGIVLCCHGAMGQGMLHAAEMILGPQRGVAIVGIDRGEGLDQLTRKLSQAIDETDRGAGVLVLTDMPGGTPCNLVAARPASERIEMVTGFNLPALLSALRLRDEELALPELAAETAAYGGRHIATLRSLVDGSG